jgi:REP element-mobilizing transposase RayT
MQNEQLKGGNYYHIYNRGNNRMNLFSIPSDYERFLELYDKYISQVADTFAWVLMPNHIHLLLKIKENMVYKYSPEKPISGKLIDVVGWEKWFEEHKWETIDLSDNVGMNNIVDLNADRSVTLSGLYKTPVTHRHFAYLFNAYTRYYHNRTGGCGNLFERPFKRKRINDIEYLKRVILYIHNNPIHHGFSTHPLEYSWSSYLTYVSDKQTELKRETAINWFGNDQNFKSEHKKPIDYEFMDKWLDVGIDYVTGVTDLSAFAEPAPLRLSGGPDNVTLTENVK